MDRKSFDYGNDWNDVSIVLHDDVLTIEASAEYGDSEIGWGSTTVTLTFAGAKLEAFRRFLNGE